MANKAKQAVAVARWTTEAGTVKTYEYNGRGTPTHCVIDTSDDGLFVGWTKDPAQYIRRRETDYGHMIALDLEYPSDDAVNDSPETESVDRGIEGAPEKVITSNPAPLITGDMNSWDVYFSKASMSDLAEKMGTLAQYSVTANTETAKANFRADLERVRAEFDRRKESMGLTEVPSPQLAAIVEAVTGPNALTNTVVAQEPVQASEHVIPEAVQVPVPAETVTVDVPAPKAKAKAKPKKVKAVSTFVPGQARNISRVNEHIVASTAYAAQDLPNHFTHDSLGDPATCTGKHNHPETYNWATIHDVSVATRAAVSIVEAVLYSVAFKPKTYQLVHAVATHRGHVARVLNLLSAIPLVKDVDSAGPLAYLALAIAEHSAASVENDLGDL